jgi:hypothetical protein
MVKQMPQLTKAIFVFSVVAVSAAIIVYTKIYNKKEDLVDPWRGIKQF